MTSKSLLNHIEGLVSHPWALPWLAIISFAESMVFPLPADLLFIPMVLARPQRYKQYVAVAVVASCLGSIAGYALGFYSYETVVHPLATWLGISDALEEIRIKLQSDTTLLWTLLLSSGLTHVPPIKVVTLGSGIAHVPFMTFLISGVVSRLARFWILGWLLAHLKPPQIAWFKRYGSLIGAIIGGIVVLCLSVRAFKL